MKKIILITITFISISIYSQQIEFEKVFGKQNVNTLNKLLENFENTTLKSLYPNLNTKNAYRKFLEKIVETNSFSEINVFPETNFKLNIYCVPDSLWIEKKENSNYQRESVIKTKYKCLNAKGEFIYTNSTSFCCKEKEETLALFEKEKTRVQINFSGLFIESLERISSESRITKAYLEKVNLIGEPIIPFVMAEYILKNKIEIDDYFTKRLIFINIIYR